MKKALVAMDDGMPIRTAARDHCIPSSTLRGHVYGKALYRKRGRKGVLSDIEEQELVDYLLKMQELGYPFTLRQLQEKIAILTQTRVTPFKEGVLGSVWMRCFRRRHPELAIHKP